MKLVWTTFPILSMLVFPSLSQDDCSNVDPTPHPDAGDDTVVVAFEGVHQRYGSEDTRTVTTDVVFPEEQYLYKQILLNYTLSCPEGGCDPWDRTAYVNVIANPGEADELNVEVGRFITPYGVGYGWSVDVTDLRPILAGSRRVESYASTWVDPGWLVDVSFEFIGGEPDRRAIEILPLQRGYYTYGNPEDPIDNTLVPVTHTIPAGISDGLIRVFATGHGFGYTENCAEFCAKDHTLSVGGVSDTLTVWRDDCVQTGAPNQAGTWWYSRAGWCPGADVYPREWEVGDQLIPGAEVTFGYDVQNYINLEEDGDPYLIISSYLILFE